MIVGDTEEVFSPIENGLLVDYIQSRNLIESLLTNLPTIFQNRVLDSAVGAAAMAGLDALKKFGGKLSIFMTGLPQYGIGTLKNREDLKIIGTDKEKTLFEPQDYFWPKLGRDCALNGVNVDLYIFPTGYVDLASLGTVSSISGGDVYYYSGFDPNSGGIKFANDLQRSLSRTFGYDALLRIRTSNGMHGIYCRITNR